jgi:Mlc titration factor MtfA (ptsG expression regulator)
VFIAGLIAAAALAVLVGLIVPPIRRSRRRLALQAEPLPEPVRDVVDRRLEIRARLPADLRRRHDGLISAFLAEKRFVGCNGLVIDDEIRATIAAQACLLALGRPGSLYDELLSILVYPTAFWVDDEVHHEDGLVTKRRRALSGEAWDSHRVVLSWEDVADSAATQDDGFNLVLHEFAHYLEAEGHGLPPLPPQRERSSAARVRARKIDDWADDLADEFDALLDAVDRGEETFLDPYAAEDEAEFFAVATEDFYERSQRLREAHPRLYALLREFYGVDPAGWVSAS